MCCIMRTTIDIDGPILREIRALVRKEGKTMGTLVSELLADALSRRGKRQEPQAFKWISREMGSRVNIEDKEALYAALDER